MVDTKSAAELLWITIVAYGMIAMGIVTALVLMCTGTKAAYGRYGNSGIASKATISARLAWFLQELPAFVVPVVLILKGRLPYIWRFSGNAVLVALFLLHYFQRTFIFSCLIKGGKPTPVVTFILALVFCDLNGHMQGAFHGAYVRYPDFWSHWTSYVGIFMFVLGMAINIHSDYILRNLRKPGETGYKIPQGGLFDLVTGANYFGEIVEWVGFAIAAQGTLPSVAFALFTLCNIGPRAIQHHRWYKEKFEDYPATRKALIPFLL